MLVLICGIRKMVECIFTKRELRLLDDLLPEFQGKQRRRTSNKPGSRRYRRKVLDIDDIEDQPGASKSSRKDKFKSSKKKQKEKMDVELHAMNSQRPHSRRAIMLDHRSSSPSVPPYPKKDLPKLTRSRRLKDVTDLISDGTLSVHSKKEPKKNEMKKKPRSRRGSLEPSSPPQSYKLKKRRNSPPMSY